jgi:murein DD-endopeptidase MepM/ murein hydrolase activator NlpD
MDHLFNRARRLLVLALVGLAGCAHTAVSRYEATSPTERARFKHVILPLPPGTRFKISQGAFGRNTHNDPGHEYTWDFDVPFGTPVLSVEDGTVIQVWEPAGPGGCDPKFNETPHNIKIRHRDGTVAQYVHVDARIHVGDDVKQGQVIAVTAQNGFICTPQLDFGIYQDDQHLYGSGQMRSIPLVFDGLPDGGMGHEGYEGAVSVLNEALPLMIREWDEASYYRHPMQPFPKRIQFTSNGRTLVFVATKHKAATASRRAIDAALDGFTPDVMLIEGIHSDWGTSPRRWDQDLDARINQDGYETYYAYKRAVEMKLPFVGSEPPGKMSEYTSHERDLAAVRLIWELMGRYPKVMVVYGAGHFVQEEPALVQLFGKPSSVQ